MTTTASLVQAILLTFALVVILMPPFIAPAEAARLRQAHPRRGAADALRQGRHADDGRRADDRRRRRLGAALPRRRRRDEFLGPQTIAPLLTLLLVGGWVPPTTTSTRRPARASASARSCSGRSSSPACHRLPDPADLRRPCHQRPVRRRCRHRAVGVRPVRRLHHRRHQQRRQLHRRPRRPGRRHADLRLRRLHDHRPARRADRTWPSCARC